MFKTFFYNCYYCGRKCSDINSKEKYVKKTFTNIDIVSCSNSNWVCDECVYFFNSDSKINMIDGEVRIGSPRLYSWIITKNKKLAASKKHIKKLREIILNPPSPPFRIVLSDSGKKNLVFRSKIANSIDNYPLQFEEELLYVNIRDLKNRLYLTDRLSAVMGKIAVSDCGDVKYAILVNNYYNDLTEYERWLCICKQPLSRLALWLAKNKEDAQNEYSKYVS
jgi:hypothetical protein